MIDVPVAKLRGGEYREFPSKKMDPAKLQQHLPTPSSAKTGKNAYSEGEGSIRVSPTITTCLWPVCVQCLAYYSN